jgi:hypothetical protein
MLTSKPEICDVLPVDRKSATEKLLLHPWQNNTLKIVKQLTTYGPHKTVYIFKQQQEVERRYML